MTFENMFAHANIVLRENPPEQAPRKSSRLYKNAKDINIYLEDIIFSISLIERYIEGISETEFEESYDNQDKVIRRSEIIAEAGGALRFRTYVSFNQKVKIWYNK